MQLLQEVHLSLQDLHQLIIEFIVSFISFVAHYTFNPQQLLFPLDMGVLVFQSQYNILDLIL